MRSETPLAGELILYQTEDGRTRVECRFQDETLWLSQALMAELFQVTVPTINEHLKALYSEGELSSEGTIRKFRIVQNRFLPWSAISPKAVSSSRTTRPSCKSSTARVCR